MRIIHIRVILIAAYLQYCLSSMLILMLLSHLLKQRIMFRGAYRIRTCEWSDL
nr:MAG TPA: hypothetical protein [Caudoviricetes sp.]